MCLDSDNFSDETDYNKGQSAFKHNSNLISLVFSVKANESMKIKISVGSVCQITKLIFLFCSAVSEEITF